MFPLLVFAWLVALLMVQLYGIGVDAGVVDRLQAAATSTSEDRVAEKVGVSSTAAAEPRRRERWLGWPQAEAPPPRAVPNSGSSPFPDKNRGVGFGQLLQGAAASTSGNKESSHSPAAATDVDLPRGPSGRRAASDGDGGPGALTTASHFCRDLWPTLRQEILGEGPWLMWFLPTPANLSSEAEERIYAPHDISQKNMNGTS